MERLPTGIPVLDRELDGGLPAGSVVALKADPASQSELFLNTFAGVRETLYLTTVRSVEAVESGLSASAVETGDPVVETVDGEDPIEDARERLPSIPDDGTVIVDPTEPLEDADPLRYRSLLTDLVARTDETDATAILHALKTGDERSRNRLVTEQVADVVFDLRTVVTGTAIENRLAVPKFRGGAALEEPVKLKLTDTVSVDTSRDIA
ncbi:DNA repair protein RadA/Sms [Halorubrum aquaticum]|uniref:DNA repair protein RadA/Sms n=1 Tax=Halorubrum aquaticum TaxID=387340 RepID=A0A1I3BBQ3_9EURY|nr:transcriptional regulator [Halorubrum aquaticum]SFH59747.1 DNA repair protein RadA/Sms [Halorubrum aquaticum]